VFYAVDESLRLYFVSDPRTRHALQGTANPNVAATIHEHDQPWEGIRGVQIEGRLAIVPATDRPRVASLYLQRFPAVDRLVNAPGTDTERLVGERFAAATFYSLSPGLVRFIDNRRGFGHREEFIVHAEARHR
jgi:uncharacterized protein YhbP (UPF0306 family)